MFSFGQNTCVRKRVAVKQETHFFVIKMEDKHSEVVPSEKATSNAEAIERKSIENPGTVEVESNKQTTHMEAAPDATVAEGKTTPSSIGAVDKDVNGTAESIPKEASLKTSSMADEQIVANATPQLGVTDVASVTNAPETPPQMEVTTVPVESNVNTGNNDANPVESVVSDENTMDCETSQTPLQEVSGSDNPSTAVNTTNGLSLLAAYSSDADSETEEFTESTNKNNNDDVIEVPVTSSSTARRQVVAVSSDSDSTSSSDSDSEGEYLTVLRKKIEKRINTEDCDDDDDDFDDDSKQRRRQPPKVRGELLLDELPPIHQLEITVPEDECIELGKVQSIVDQLVLVSVLPNSMLFDLDTVLFLEKGRKVLGQVFDVLGQVADPLYCVRFNSNQQIKDRGINIGDIVYCAPQTEHTQFVILSKLMQVRGSDASWEHDVEPPARFIDYSDDEAEREARWEQRKKRQRDRKNSSDSVETVATTATEKSEAPSAKAAAPRQRGRRGQRDGRSSYQNNQQHDSHQQGQSHSQSHDSQYNYHPSYNPGSWHSNYYHNFHPPAANFNMMPGMGFPIPAHGYGYMPPQGHPYGMPMAMGMPPPHMYPAQSPYAHPGHPAQKPQQQQAPNSGS